MTPEKEETRMRPEKAGPDCLTVRLLSPEEKQRTRFLYE